MSLAKLRGFSPLKTCADFSRSAALSQKAALQMPFYSTTPSCETKKAPRISTGNAGRFMVLFRVTVYSSILPKLKSAKSSTRSVRLGAMGAALSASRGA